MKFGLLFCYIQIILLSNCTDKPIALKKIEALQELDSIHFSYKNDYFYIENFANTELLKIKSENKILEYLLFNVDSIKKYNQYNLTVFNDGRNFMKDFKDLKKNKFGVNANKDLIFVYILFDGKLQLKESINGRNQRIITNWNNQDTTYLE